MNWKKLFYSPIAYAETLPLSDEQLMQIKELDHRFRSTFMMGDEYWFEWYYIVTGENLVTASMASAVRLAGVCTGVLAILAIMGCIIS